MKVIQYNNFYTSNIDNMRGSCCLPHHNTCPPLHTNSPRVTNRKGLTKSRVFPERYIDKYEVSYRTTNTDEYIHPKIKEKFEKLRIPNMNAYSSSDEPNKCFVKPNSPKNSNKTRELSKEKSVLVGKLYSTPLNNNSQVTNNNQFADWNNPKKIHSTLKSL